MRRFPAVENSLRVCQVKNKQAADSTSNRLFKFNFAETPSSTCMADRPYSTINIRLSR